MIFISKFVNILRTIKVVIAQKQPVISKLNLIFDYLKCVVFRRIYDKNQSFNLTHFKINYSVYGGFEYAFTDIFINNDYWFKTNNESPFIIDCGSNIGLSVLYFKALYPKAKIIGFEPDYDAYKCLETNVKQNNLSDVLTHNKALALTESTLKLSYDENRPGSITSTTEDITSVSYREVPAVKLSTYIDEPVDFLKMDIEGAENSVFEELHQSGKLKLIKHIILEYHHHIGSKKDCLSSVLHILEENNFSYQMISSFSNSNPIDTPQLIMIHCLRNIR